MVPQPDVVYVAPLGSKLALIDGLLCVVARVRKERYMPIDFFLHSVANNWGADAAAVILSGAGDKNSTDGVDGLRAIKAHGGFTLVQEPTDAEQADLPQQAIATGAVDVIGTAGELARQVAEIWRAPNPSAPDSMPVLVPEAEAVVENTETEDSPEVENSAETINRILAELYTQTGNDLTHYKRSTILRRIARRLQVNKIGNIADYYAYLAMHPEESQALFKDCLISVTNFFRDPAVWEELRTKIIPALLASRVPCVLDTLHGHAPLGLFAPDDVGDFVAAAERVLAAGPAAGRTGIDAGLVEALDWTAKARRIVTLLQQPAVQPAATEASGV